jgi:hypothetical protein
LRELLQGLLAREAELARQLSAVLEQYERRCAAYPEPCRDRGRVVDIELADAQPALLLARQTFQQR